MTDKYTLDCLVAFIAQNLAKQASIGQRQATIAIAETAKRFNNSSWFWTDDNAKTAELLCFPPVWKRHPVLAKNAIDFVLQMSRGAIIQRRCGVPELQVVADDPRAFHVRNAFVALEGDLSRGVLRHSTRFNDGRSVDVMQHTGNYVGFTVDGRRHVADIEDGISGFAMRREDGRVVLSHSTGLLAKTGVLGRQRRSVGTITYEYTLFADRSALELCVTLTPEPGVALRDVVVTTAVDQAGKSVEFRSLCVGADSAYVTSDRLGRDARTAHVGRANYLGLIQPGSSPGFSYALHCLLTSGDRLQSVVTTCPAEDRVHWMVMRYALGAVEGGPVVVKETRLLTAGGYYDEPGHYRDLMASAADGGIDPSMTYDIGAELNAVAVHYLFGVTGQYAAQVPSPSRLAELRHWYDRHLERYFGFIRPGDENVGGRIFIRGLAFALLSLDCMLRATGDRRYKARMDQGLALLLGLFDRLQVGDGIWEGAFIDSWTGRMPFLDVHASGLLALARCALHGDPGGRYAQAMAEATRAVRLTTATVTPGPGSSVYCDTLAVRGRVADGEVPQEDTGYWNFKLGVLLRALRSVQRAHAVGAVALHGATIQRIELLVQLATRFIRQSMREHPGTLEVLTSQRSGETNSETQPWVALGLVPSLDEAIGAIAVPAAAE